MKVSRVKTKHLLLLILAFASTTFLCGIWNLWNHFHHDPVGSDTDHTYFGDKVTEVNRCSCLSKTHNEHNEGNQTFTEDEIALGTCSKVGFTIDNG